MAGNANTGRWCDKFRTVRARDRYTLKFQFVFLLDSFYSASVLAKRQLLCLLFVS